MGGHYKEAYRRALGAFSVTSPYKKGNREHKPFSSGTQKGSVREKPSKLSEDSPARGTVEERR